MVLVNIFAKIAIICFGIGTFSLVSASIFNWNLSKCINVMVDAYKTGLIFGAVALAGLFFV